MKTSVGLLIALVTASDAFVTLPMLSRKKPAASSEEMARIVAAQEAAGVSVPVSDWIKHTADLQVRLCLPLIPYTSCK